MMACSATRAPFGITIAALLSLAAGARHPVTRAVALASPLVDDVAADTASLGLGSGEESSLIEAEQPVVAENSMQDHGVDNTIKHFRQGPFNEGDRPIDIYCLMIQNALKRSFKDRLAEKNIEIGVESAGPATPKQFKLASAGNVSCRTVYRSARPGMPDKDPYVEIEFGTKGLDIVSARTAGGVSSPSNYSWLGMTVDLGFTMDLEFAFKINTVNYNAEITKSQVANFKPRSASEESTASSVTALCLRLGAGALATAAKVAGYAAPTCVTNGIAAVFSRIGGNMLTQVLDPASSCSTLKTATMPLATTKLDVKSIDPVLVQGNLVEFRAEQVSISPDFTCTSLSFNGQHLIADLKDIEVDAQVFVDRVVPVAPEDGEVMHEIDLESIITTNVTVHIVQSIKVDLNILEPENISIVPSNATLKTKVAQGGGTQPTYMNMLSTATKKLAASMAEQLGQVIYKLAAMILEKQLKKELRKDMPLLDQHGGAASALDALTGGSPAALRSALSQLWKAAEAKRKRRHRKLRLALDRQRLPVLRRKKRARVDDVTADTASLDLGSGEESSFIEAEQPVVAENSTQDHGVDNTIKHFRQGPFNEGDRPIDIYCLMIHNALKQSLKDILKEKNIETSVELARPTTPGQFKLASTGNVSCRAVYRAARAGMPDEDPYVEIEFGTKGLDIASARTTAGVQSPSNLGMTVDLGFTMDLDFAFRINTVSYKAEITKSQVANFKPRSASEESKASSVTALCLRLGAGALATGAKVADYVAPTCVTNGITAVFSRIGGNMLTQVLDPASSCSDLKTATMPLAITKMDFKSIDPVPVLGNLVEFRAEQVSISPDFTCTSLSFNGYHLIVDLKDIEVDAQVFVDRVVPVATEDGEVMHKIDLESMINTNATVHIVQSIKVDLDVLEPENISIVPSNVTLKIKVAQGNGTQPTYTNILSTATKKLGASMVEQLGQVIYKLAAMILERQIKKELRKDMPLLEQHGGAASALDALTGGPPAALSSAWSQLWKAAEVVSHKGLEYWHFYSNLSSGFVNITA